MKIKIKMLVGIRIKMKIGILTDDDGDVFKYRDKDDETDRRWMMCRGGGNDELNVLATVVVQSLRSLTKN